MPRGSKYFESLIGNVNRGRNAILLKDIQSPNKNNLFKTYDKALIQNTIREAQIS